MEFLTKEQLSTSAFYAGAGIVQLEYRLNGGKRFRRALIPVGYESEAVLLESFVREFKHIRNVPCEIDIFYECKFDFHIFCLPFTDSFQNNIPFTRYQ